MSLKLATKKKRHISVEQDSTTGHRTLLRSALFDELDRRGKGLTYKQLSRETDIPKNTLERVIRGESNPYYQTQRKLSNFLNISDTELNRLLKNQAIGHQNIPDAHLPSSNEEVHANPLRKPRLGKFLLAGVIILLLLIWTWVATRENQSCLIDLRSGLDEVTKCDGLGSFAITGTHLDPWNGRLTTIDVPQGWTVVAKYEYWIPPEYKTVDPQRDGFILLNSGLNFLNRDTYDLYKDYKLTDLLKTTEERELNDRIQYLIISSFNQTPLKLYAHGDLDPSESVQISPLN